MLFEGLKSVRKQRAALERNRVLIGSMIKDSAMSEMLESVKGDYFESVSDSEIEELIARIPESDETSDVDKILNSDGDMTLDDILGIDSVEVDDEEIA